jgi:tRNA (adenine22-N1)-methyltransferase
MQNSIRIDAIKSLVPTGTRLLDIGTDHAGLPISLLKEGKIISAVASDVNILPLKRAEQEINKNGFADKIKTILSNGFENIDITLYNSVAICGMGGHLIAEIIEKGKEKSRFCTLILQPMSYPEALRKYLFDNGFEITDEVFVTEKNKTYVIISTKYTGKNSSYTTDDLYLGKIRPLVKEYQTYENKIKKRFQKKLLGSLKSILEKNKNA